MVVVNWGAVVAAGGGCTSGRQSKESRWSVWRRSRQQQQWLRRGTNLCSGGEPPGLRLQYRPEAVDRAVNVGRVRRRLL